MNQALMLDFQHLGNLRLLLIKHFLKKVVRQAVAWILFDVLTIHELHNLPLIFQHFVYVVDVGPHDFGVV